MKTTTKQTKQTAKQKRIAAAIRAANRKYKRATPAGRRVLIAQDALEQIRLNRVRVRRGFFCDINPINTFTVDIGQKMVQLQPILMDPTLPPCRGCALGTLFLSSIRMRNRFSVNEDTFSNIDENIIPKLTEFSQKQRELIEIAFEFGGGYHQVCNERLGDGSLFFPDEDHDAANDWASEFLGAEGASDTERLVAILKNIIRNKGRFDPYSK